MPIAMAVLTFISGIFFLFGLIKALKGSDDDAMGLWTIGGIFTILNVVVSAIYLYSR